MSDSVRPHRRQPIRLPHPWDSPGKNTGVGCHFLLQCMKGESESEVAQSCPTLSDPMDCSPMGSSVHGIFQARVLEWGAIAFSARPFRYDLNQIPYHYTVEVRWQEYTELYKRPYDLDNHDGVISHIESDILECEVKWTSGSITMNKGM